MRFFFALAPSWIEIVTAVATLALAALAGFSAYYAYHLWREAKGQFAELKRSTDMDIALRMLERCDEAGLTKAEQLIWAELLDRHFDNLKAFAEWMMTLPDNEREAIVQAASNILNAYEHIGIVARKNPEVAAILVDYLCLRAPIAFDALKPFIEMDRARSPSSHDEFSDFVEQCREFSKHKHPGPVLSQS